MDLDGKLAILSKKEVKAAIGRSPDYADSLMMRMRFLFGGGNRIIHMAFVPAMGLSQANAASVGQNLGAGNVDRAEKSTKTALLMIGIILLPIALGMFFFGADISRAFVDDPEVIDLKKYEHPICVSSAENENISTESKLMIESKLHDGLFNSGNMDLK